MICDACRQETDDAGSMVDAATGISVCYGCMNPYPRVVVFCSASQASNQAVLAFQSDYFLNVKHVFVATQLKGSLWKRLKAFCRHALTLAPTYVAYKMWDTIRGVGLCRRLKIRSVPFTLIKDVNSREVKAKLKEIKPDFAVCLFANQRFYKDTIKECGQGIVNVHGSLLPADKGPAQYWYYHRERRRTGGVTIHFMDDAFDCGDIITQVPFEISESDSMADIHKRIAILGLWLVSVEMSAQTRLVGCPQVGEGNVLPLPQRKDWR